MSTWGPKAQKRFGGRLPKRAKAAACLGCGGQSQKSKMAQAVEKMNRQRHEHLRAMAAENEDQTQIILDRHRERPKGFGYPGPTETKSKLFLGSLYDALDADLLRTKGITHAVNATQAEMCGDSILRQWVRVDDDPDSDIFPHFYPVCDFVDQALAQDGRVLVHCEQGISRSCTLVCAYTMKRERTSALETLQALKRQRAIVDPNPGFLKALISWEEELKLKKVSSLSELKAVCAPIQRAHCKEAIPAEDIPVAAWRVRSKSNVDVEADADAPASSWFPMLRSRSNLSRTKSSKSNRTFDEPLQASDTPLTRPSSRMLSFFSCFPLTGAG